MSDYLTIELARLRGGHVQGERAGYHNFNQAKPGFVVKRQHDWGEPGAPAPERYTVDHQGAGQPAKLASYAATLREAGLTVEVRPKYGQRKPIVWVMA